jgi:hypothetical protein
MAFLVANGRSPNMYGKIAIFSKPQLFSSSLLPVHNRCGGGSARSTLPSIRDARLPPSLLWLDPAGPPSLPAPARSGEASLPCCSGQAAPLSGCGRGRGRCSCGGKRSELRGQPQPAARCSPCSRFGSWRGAVLARASAGLTSTSPSSETPRHVRPCLHARSAGRRSPRSSAALPAAISLTR